MKKWLPLMAWALLGLNRTSSATLYSVGLDTSQFTSDFMIGKVVVGIVFADSNGSVDPKSETWSDDRKAQVVSEIMNGMDWWTQQNPKSPLSFVYDVKTLQTAYEPITRPYTDEALWVPDMMAKLGYIGDQFTTTTQYVNDLRTQYNTDWGFVYYIIDSFNTVTGEFADGHFGYAYIGGPYAVMTYDNDGYGIGNMDVVAAHELGHIFHALDEYAGAVSGPNSVTNGYFQVINGNDVYSPTFSDSNSIMLGGIRWDADAWTRQMVGWRDSTNSGRDDIVNCAPLVTMNSPSLLGSGANFSGEASVAVLTRQGSPPGIGMTVDTIAKVEYSVANGSWTDATPLNGAVNLPREAFTFSVPTLSPGTQSLDTQSVNVRAITQFTLDDAGGSAAGGGGGGTPPPAVIESNLDHAHPFPNPFKPNSNLGESQITFTDLTPGAKVRVYTAQGERVFEQDSAGGTLLWNAVNLDGEPVGSGVYFYFISDQAGNTKKGKLAVIR